MKRIHGVLQGKENDLLAEYEYDGSGSFVYFELAKANQIFADRIMDSTEEELPLIFNDMAESGYISYKINPKDIDLSSEDFHKLTVDEKKRFLMELLDLNQLYVNYCDIDDESYAVSEEDKMVSKSFYEGV